MRFVKISLCALLMALLPVLSGLAQAEQAGSVGYAVRALLPDNQAEGGATFFDLIVQPAARQTLCVMVKNRKDHEIQVAVAANRAITNANGVIEFIPSEARDPSLAVDFSHIVAPLQDVILVPPHGEALAEFELTLPLEPFEGVVYGGLMFTMLDQGAAQDGAGMNIRNIYRYVLGVRLRQDETPVEPQFELIGVQAAAGEDPHLLLALRNPAALIVKGLSLCADVYPQGGDQPIYRYEARNLAMAPNSAMDYVARMKDRQPIPAGEYLVKVELTYEGQLWLLDAPLTVGE